ncbi:MAG: filamentous hemagglutinin N-terminal domain-containing protein [Calothrix sp. MO_167.B12]|nr:filamentous hemagglutinin N-terminal domain-containing protein [Calothrix sp. MO_167.B12]
MLKLIPANLYIFCGLTTYYLLVSQPAIAQNTPSITSDNSLNTNVLSSPDGKHYLINSGTRSGNNLFHSFDQFSIPSEGSAFFDNATNIQNIFGRVTGGNVSIIDGAIRANGTASLFLLNPSGVIFGPNASLDIGGSFVTSTADSIIFEDQVKFSANDKSTPPILSIKVPVGLQYGSNPGAIEVNGVGQAFQIDDNTEAVQRGRAFTGLKVKSGQTLALIGGDVSLKGASLTAEDGRIELGSVRDSIVNLSQDNSSWIFDYKDVNANNFQDISLASGLRLNVPPQAGGGYTFLGSSLEVSGSKGGDIQVQGRRIDIIEGSAMFADTVKNDSDTVKNDSDTGGTLTIKATEAVNLSGKLKPGTSSFSFEFMSRLSTDVAPDATGVGGKLVIDTKNLTITDGGQISVGTFSSGNAGTLKVTADNVEVTGISPFGPSGLFAPVAVNATGKGGNIELNIKNRLKLDGGAQIFATTFGQGNAGNLTIKAQEVELLGTVVVPSTDGKNFSEFPTLLSANVARGATGNAGNLNLETNSLKLRDGAKITANTSSQGNAGKIFVKANSIDLSGISDAGERSVISANVEGNATGQGGDITVETQTLRIADNAKINASVFGTGKGGVIQVTAKDIELTGQNTGLFSTVENNATGDGGNISVEAQTLTVKDGAQITASTSSQGNAGKIFVKANSIDLSGISDAGERSAISANVEGNATGQGGDITVEAQTLRVADNARINTSVLGTGKGGVIQVTAKDIELRNSGSGLFSFVVPGAQGVGGDLQITTDNLKIFDGAGIVTAIGGSGRAGNITINATKSVELIGTSTSTGDRSGLFASAVIDKGDGGNISLTTDKLIIQDGAIINVSNFAINNPNTRPGQGKTGNLQIEAKSVLLDSAEPENFSRITASSAAQDGGTISLNVQDSLIARNGSKILAETRGDGKGGIIDINSSSVEFTTGAAISTNTTAKGDGGSINIQTNKLSLDGSSTGLFSEATANSSGDGGDINIKSKRVSLTNGAQISTNSADLGQAGNINILFEQLETNQGQITATSEKTGGGDISLIATASEIFLRNNSSVSTSVFDSTGGGGDIFISADAIALLENSSIRADAVLGNGGNIQINTKALFVSPNSAITASSKFGVDGEVEINSTEEDKKINSKELPAIPLDRNKLVARSCSQKRNSFVVAGKGGLPLNPSQTLRSQNLWVDLRSLKGTVAQSRPKQINNSVNQTSAAVHQKVQSNPFQLREAQGWIINPNGKIELVADSPQTTFHSSQNMADNCQN